MKDKIPVYKHNQPLNEVFNGLSKKNKDLIDKFLDKCRTTASASSIQKIRGKIIPIADILEKDLDKLNKKDIRDFIILLNDSSLAVATKNDLKKILKRFLKWNYLDWSEKFNNLEDIKTKTKNEGRRLSKKDLLTKEEIEFIVNSVHSLKYKCILFLMQETANRPEEILKLKWKDIDLDSKEIGLNSSKTGEGRTIPLKESSEWLKKYKRECFYPTAEPNMWVFPQDTNRDKKLTPQLLDAKLKAFGRTLKLKKKLYPYLWRHTILSKMITTLSPKVYEMYAGHSLETGMKTYAHLNTEDLKEELDEKYYKIQELTPKEKEQIKELKETLEEYRKENSKLNKRVGKSEKLLLELRDTIKVISSGMENNLQEMDKNYSEADKTLSKMIN